MSKARLHFVSLGCPKNRVDSEIMLGHLQDAAFDVTAEADDADVIVINTCGFIEEAKKESIDTILEMAQYKDAGRLKRLVVTGCLVQRYESELRAEIPEIDVLLGNGQYHSVAKAALADLDLDTSAPRDIEKIDFLHDATTPRVNTFLPHSAYVKVAEGCDQKCTFCIIPKLRGLQRSRPIDDVVREAIAMHRRGVVELNLIAQDLTGYGHDLDPKVQLADLLDALAREDETPPWIRLHYAYPRPFSKKLLRVLAEQPKILPYIDMPLQHIADGVLKRMARGRPRRFIEKLHQDIRSAVPGVIMRTSFIVGFPGETDADFRELCEYVQGEDFEHVGVFKFSREEGTASHEMDGQIPQELVDERHAELSELLQEKSRAKKASYVGRRIEVLVDGPSEETELLIASRHKGQAPEVDGTTYINDGEAKAGDIVEVEISESFDYDLVGHVTRMIRPAPARPSHPRMEASKPEPAQRSRGSLRVLA